MEAVFVRKQETKNSFNLPGIINLNMFAPIHLFSFLWYFSRFCFIVFLICSFSYFSIADMIIVSILVLVYPILRIVAGMAGKLCNVIAFGGFYVWTGELYPTSIRSLYWTVFDLRSLNIISRYHDKSSEPLQCAYHIDFLAFGYIKMCL